jgi:hypothetical protein
MGWVVSVTPLLRFSPGERSPGTLWTGGLVSSRAGLDTEVRGRILSPLPRIESQSPSRPDTILTELPQLPIPNIYCVYTGRMLVNSSTLKIVCIIWKGKCWFLLRFAVVSELQRFYLPVASIIVRIDSFESSCIYAHMCYLHFWIQLPFCVRNLLLLLLCENINARTVID